MTAECLTDETVAELVERNPAAERMAAVEQHLSRCTSCLRRVTLAKRAVTSWESHAPGEREPGGDAILARGSRFGRYEIQRLVGAGAVGRVYAAYDRLLDRTVALKVLRPGVASAELEHRLLREAKAMARLSHPSVITVFDAGKEAGRIFIVMELVRGGTLREWLAAERRSWREVVDVFVRAGRGLAEAHAAGIVHRDFKPDNVLMDDDGRVRVTDFGLACYNTGADSLAETVMPGGDDCPTGLGAALTRTREFIGTPAYMAPEQFDGTSACAGTDVYAFCTALFEALYGQRPFTATSLMVLAREKRLGKVASPPSERGVPVALRRAVVVGLRSEPEGRYASMAELLAALQNAAGPPVERRPRPRPAWMVGAFGLGLVVLGAYAGWSRMHGSWAARSSVAAATATPPVATARGDVLPAATPSSVGSTAASFTAAALVEPLGPPSAVPGAHPLAPVRQPKPARAPASAPEARSTNMQPPRLDGAFPLFFPDR
jgi:hypothetical protein